MSRSFQCLIVDGRKEFLKSDVLHLGTLMLWEYLVTYLLVLAIVDGHIDVKYGGALMFHVVESILVASLHLKYISCFKNIFYVGIPSEGFVENYTEMTVLINFLQS